MKKRILVPIIIIMITSFCPLSGAGGAGAIVLPSVTEASLENGAGLFIMKDELPVLTVLVTIGYGTLHEGKGDAGMASLLARTLSLSGTAAFPGNQLHEKIESMGGHLAVSSSWENITITLTVLDRFTDEALALLGDFIARPLFTEDAFRTALNVEVETLRRKNDDPATVAFERARMIIFDGKGYGAVATPENVAGYTMDRVGGLWDRVAVGGNILVAVSSPRSDTVVRNLCDRYFAHWQKGPRTDYADDSGAADRVRNCRGKIFFIEKDIPQATVVVGTVAPTRSSDDTPSLEIMNYILGEGSFNSVLMREIRVKKGLAYAVQSVVRPRYHTGVFLAYAATKNQSAGEVLGIMESGIVSMTRDVPEGRDLQWARDSLCNSYVFEFDTPQSVLAKYLDVSYNRLPKGYLVSWPSRIASVRPADVRDSAARLFNTGLVRVVVGGADARKSLEGRGEVVELYLTP